MDNKKIIFTLLLLSLIYTILFSCLRVMQHENFFSFEWEDDARENQIVYNIAAFFSPHQTIHQTNRPAFLNDHFSPIYFLIAVFYLIYPHIYTWYVLMSFGYGFSALIVYLIGRDILRDTTSAFAIALAYLFYPPLHYVNLGALDARVFLLPLLFLTMYFLYLRRFGFYILCMFLSFLVFEDVPLIFIFLAILLYVKKYGKQWWIITGVSSIVYFALAVSLANKFCRIQGFNSCPLIANGGVDYLDIGSMKDIPSFLFYDTRTFIDFISDWSKIKAGILLLYPLLFLPLFSLEVYVPLIMYIEIVLGRGKFMNENSYYLAPIIPFIFVSLVVSAAKIKSKFGIHKARVITISVVFLCIVSGFGRNIIGCTAKESGVLEEPESRLYDTRFINVKNIFDRRIYGTDMNDKAAWEMIALIPKDAAVTASGDLLPALSSRRIIYEFALNIPAASFSLFPKATYPNYEVDYILINRQCVINGLGGHYAFLVRDRLEEEIRALTSRHGFMLQRERGSFVLLKRRYL